MFVAPTPVSCKTYKRPQGLNNVADGTTATAIGGQMRNVAIEVDDFKVLQRMTGGTVPDEKPSGTAIPVRDG
jgi:hypothetical protein